MFLSVARLRRIAAGMSDSRSFISTTSAASMATSEPEPIAIPTLALVSAGASFTPSPAMATTPFAISSRITLSLSPGSTPAITSSTPACFPIASAVTGLSPVSITTLMPMLCSSSIPRGLSSLMVSATAIMPRSSSSRPKKSGVLPSFESLSASAVISRGTEICSLTNLQLPPSKGVPSITAVTPFPGRALNSSVSPASIPSCSALETIAPARGCSLFLSSAKAADRSSSSLFPLMGMMSVTFGSPLVMVPVLSRATIFVLPVISRAAAVLNSIPFFAPTPLPTIIATGVASPSAHGQLITSTEMPLASAKPAVCPAIIHAPKVIAAITITAGTNIPATLSAAFAMGAFVAAASLTI